MVVLKNKEIKEYYEYVILHEKVHISRKDVWMKYLAVGFLGLFWFQPLLWLACRLFLDDMEEASYTSFSISFNDYEYNNEIYKDEFKLNGMDVVTRIHNSLCDAAISQKDGHVNIYVHLPSGAEENFENVQKALETAFSKTK